MSGIPMVALDPSALIAQGIQNTLGQFQTQQLQQQAHCTQLNALFQLQGGGGPLHNVATPIRTGNYERERAKVCIDACERLIIRLDFWGEIATVPLVGIFADLKIARLADRIDRLTGEAERWLSVAAQYDAEKGHGTNAPA